MSKEFMVVHVEWGRHWSGGTQQVALLLEGLRQCGVNGYLVCQEGSMLAERMQGKLPMKTVNLRGEHDLFAWKSFAKWLSAFRNKQASVNQSVLIHVHSRRGALLTLIIARLLKLPTILHWRVAAPLHMPIKLLADAVIAISKAACDFAIKGGAKPEKVFLIRSAICVKEFERPNKEVSLDFRQQWGISENTFVIAETARMVSGKGHDVILKAVANLPSGERPTVLMAGDGPEWKKLQELAQELGISDFVHFMGFLDDVRSVLWASDIFVHVPTFFPEGISVAILEAMAAGLPVIASKVGGIPEVVRDGETGLTVPPNDPEALVEAINRLRQDKNMIEQLGKQAQAWVQENHDARQLPERVLQVYNQVIAKKL